MATDFTSEVTQLYEDIQYRAPDTADLTTYVALLTSGQATVASITSDIENDPFTVNVVDAVIREYQAAFGRVPDQAGVAFWVDAVAANPAALATLNVTFANSPEFFTLYGATATTPGLNNVALVSALYENVLGRTPDQAGLDFWVSQNLDAAQLLQDFAQSAEFIADTAAAIIVYQNLEAAGTPATTGSLFDLSPTSFILTTGNDHVNGYTNVTGDLTPYFYNGIGPTLNTGDVITNVTTLTITDEYGTGNDIIPAGAQLSNITNVILDTAGNAGNEGNPFSTVGITGVETLTINSGGAGFDYAAAGPDTAVVDNQGNRGADAGVEILGGSSVNVTSNGSGGVYVGLAPGGGVAPESTAQLATGAVFVNENGTGATYGETVAVIGGTSVTVNVNSPSNGGDIDIGNTSYNTGDFTGPLAAATDPTGAIVVTDAAQYGGDIDAANNAEITIYGGTTVNVTAAGEEIVVGDPAAYDLANQPTGDVTITNTGLQTWSDLTDFNGLGQEEDVFVSGGHNVTVTTNTGNVTVGDYDGFLDPTGTTALAGTQPTGNVTIVDTATQDLTSISVYGGVNVAINGPNTVSAADILVGEVQYVNPVTGLPVAIGPTGNVTIYDNAAVTWAGSYGTDASGNDIYVGTAGIGHTIEVLDGANISITTNTASVEVGSYGLEGLPGTEPTGNVTIVDTATALNNNSGATELAEDGTTDASVYVYGGVNATVTASGAYVNIGYDDEGVVYAPTGAVVVTDTATALLAYDGTLNNYDVAVDVLGGTTVNVTTNVGDVVIGEEYTPSPGAEPSGDVTVVDNASAYVGVYGGDNVNVTLNAQPYGDDTYLQVGDGANPAHSLATDPTGNVTTTMTGIETGWIFESTTKIEGGVNIDVNTTGGNVYVGTDYEGYGAAPVTGTVDITDSYGGRNEDNIAVMGGTTVDITTSASHDNYIDVGALPESTPVLASAADDPTGIVTIYDATVNGSTTTYGDEEFDVVTNGSTAVNVTGGAGADNFIIDLQSVALGDGEAGATAASLATVDLTGVNGITGIVSDALTTVTIADSARWVLTDIYNDTLASNLTVNLSNDANAHIYDEGGEPESANYELAYINNLTVNTTGTTASTVALFLPGATSITFNDAANLTLSDSWPGTYLPNVETITVTGAGTTILGDLSGAGSLTSIDAHTATGGVEAQINAGVSFDGGSGNDIVALTSGVTLADLTAGVLISGGGGTNTLYADFSSEDTQYDLGNNAVISGFQNLGVVGYAEGDYAAEGFRGLIVGAYDPYTHSYVGVSGEIDFYNVENGASLTLINPDNLENIYYQLQTPGGANALTINIGADTTATQLGTSEVIDAVHLYGYENDITTVTIDSAGAGGAASYNDLQLNDSALQTVTITGDASLVLYAPDDYNYGGPSVIDASASSGNILLEIFPNENGITVTSGSGEIGAYGTVYNGDAVDTYNVGTGGGLIAAGVGGAGYFYNFYATTPYDYGSETVNLSAATSGVNGTAIEVSSGYDGGGTYTTGSEDTYTFNGYGDYVVVNNWSTGTVGSGKGADAILLDPNLGTPHIIGNSTLNLYPGSDGSYYKVVDGVISYAEGSPTTSAANELRDADAIVDSWGAGAVGMVQVEVSNGAGGTVEATFIIEDEQGGGPNTTTVNNSASDIVVEITGLTGMTGFGFAYPVLTGLFGPEANADPTLDIGAGASVSLTATEDLLSYNFDALFANVSAYNYGSDGHTETYNDAGYSLDYLDASGAGTNTTYANLANFGILQTSNGYYDISDLSEAGNVTVTQVGASPVLVVSATEDTSMATLTYGNKAIANDDPSLLLLANTGSYIEIGTIIDASNTGTIIGIAGDSDGVFIGGISDTALTTIDASQLYGDLTLTANQAGLNITGGQYANDITANGKGDVITIYSDADEGSQYVNASGAGDHIQVDAYYYDNYIGASGAGDTISVATYDSTVYITGNGESFSSGDATQLGAGDTINAGDAVYGYADVHAWLGANSTVNIAAGSDVDLHLLGDTAGAALTNMTVINGAQNADGVYLHFNDVSAGGSPLLTEAWAADGNEAYSQVNVASATSLASALNIAANQALAMDYDFGNAHTFVANQNTKGAVLEVNGHTGLLDWFQYGGNTYIVEAVNSGGAAAAHAGLTSSDIVVELTGLVTVSNHVDVALGGQV
jgi:hypothetical protein